MIEFELPHRDVAALVQEMPLAVAADEQMHNLVIVGGGFAGATLVRSLQARLPKTHRVILISEESYTTFNPMLPEVVGASIFPEHVAAPLREIVDVAGGQRFIMGRVISIDRRAKQLVCTSLAGTMVIPYQHVVLAFGNRARLDFIPGMSEHAYPLKTIGDAMEIRNLVLRRLAQAELIKDPDAQRRLVQFAVIGGGFSGVEVAGELVDYLRSIQKYYPNVPAGVAGVTIVHESDRLLPELPESLGRAAERSLHARGVKLQLNRRALSISPTGVQFAEGERVEACTTICTIGTKPNALIESLGLPLERGRIKTRADMSVAGLDSAEGEASSDGLRSLWALGDCAGVPNAVQGGGAVSPPTAQFAVRQAKHLARNLLATVKGAATAPFSYRAAGTMAAIGHMNGVAMVFGISLSGLPAWLLWRAYYLSQMPTLGRKVRIFVEWTWGMFFPADITHLRFTQSRNVDQP